MIASLPRMALFSRGKRVHAKLQSQQHFWPQAPAHYLPNLALPYPPKPSCLNITMLVYT